MELAQAFVRLRVDSSQVRKDTEKGLTTASTGTAASKSGKEAGKHFGTGFGSGFKGVLTSGAALLGIGAAIGGIKEIIDEGTKLQKSTALLTAAEKAHGLSVKANQPIIEDAVKQGNKYGVTQDVIQTGLTKLINAGVPMKEALQVQQAALSVSAVTGQDYATVLQKLTQGGGTAARTLKSLGVTQVTGATQSKALENASKLLNARISESGGLAKFAAKNHLSLAEAHKLVTGALGGNVKDYNKLNIEVLPKSATLAQNLAQAQGILNNKYGKEGVAATKTFSGQSKQLGATLKDTAATIGVKVLPFLTKLVQGIGGLVRWLTGGSGSAKLFIGAMLGLGAVVGIIKTVAFATNLLRDAQKSLTFWTNAANVSTKWLKNSTLLLRVQLALLWVWSVAVKTATVIWTAAQWALNIAMDANPVGVIVLAIVGLVAAIAAIGFAIFLLVKNWYVVWGFIKNTVLLVVHWFFSAVIPFFTHTLPHAFFIVIDWLKHNWPLVIPLLLAPMTLGLSLVVAAVIKFWPQISRFIMKVFGDISRFIAGWWGNTIRFFGSAINSVARALALGWDAIKRFVLSVFGDIGKFFSTWWGRTTKFFSDAVGSVGRVLSGGWTNIKNTAIRIFGDLGRALVTAWNWIYAHAFGPIKGALDKYIVQPFLTVFRWVRDKFIAPVKAAFQKFITDLPGVWNKIQDIVMKPVKFIVNIVYTNGIERFWNAVAGPLGLPKLGNLKLARGGPVPGYAPGQDTVPAMLSPGEYVINPRAARAIGRETLDTLNAQRFADGGAVVAKALSYNGHRYVWGGAANPQQGWDCSSFVNYILGSFGITLPHGVKWSSRTHGPTANEYQSWPKESYSKMSPGDLYVESNGQHIGFVTGKGTGFAARSTATGTGPQSVPDSIYDIYQIPGVSGATEGIGGFLKAGWDLAKKGAAAVWADLKNATADIMIGVANGLINPLIKNIPGTKTGIGHMIAQMPPKLLTKLADHIHTKNPNALANPLDFTGDAGVGTSAGTMANGKQLYEYLLKNLFGGNKIAAAGATASIWGESTWNPFAQDCVPLTYRVVTTRGVLAHDEVRVGDVTPVWNPRTGQVEGATITAIPYHYRALVCRIGNDDWSVTCTWDHKWITDAGLVRADELVIGAKLLLGDGRTETVEFRRGLGAMDTFCLTTTTGTWTTIADDDERPIWTGNSSGRGLIGWTPKGTISEADFRGGMRTQLPAILRFVVNSGDVSVIGQMLRSTSILQAANLWGRGVERFGINDVHSAGLGLARQIAGLANGGMIPEPILGIGASGQAYALGERGRERVVNSRQDPMLALLQRIEQRLADAPAKTGGAVARAVQSPMAGMAQSARVGAR
jgi:hypothetical protein